QHVGVAHPAHPEAALLVDPMFGVTSELHVTGRIVRDDLPRRAAFEPVVGHFHLITVADLLMEDAVVVADAIAGDGVAECGATIEKARSETTETTIAKAGIALLFQHFLKCTAETSQRLFQRMLHVE